MFSLKKKILYTLMLMLCFILGVSLKSLAAPGFSVSPSSITLTEGESQKVTITATDCGGNFSIISSDSNVATVSSTGDWIECESYSFTITAKAKGNTNIQVNPENVGSTDGSTDIEGAKKINVTVNAKKTDNDADDNTKTNNDTTKTTNSNTTNSNTKDSSNTELKFSNTSSTMYTTGGVNLRNGASTSAGIIKSLSKGTEVNISAKSTSKKDGYYWYKVTAGGSSGYIADTGALTTEKPEEDKEKPVLTALAVSEGKLSPIFSKDTTSYNVNIEDEDTEQVNITAVAESGANVTITCNGSTINGGKVPINEGLNTVTIKVAKDGETNTYTVKIRKAIKENEEGNIKDEKLYLKLLKVEGYELSPKFSKDIFKYTIEIPKDDDRTTLDITAKGEEEEYTIEIAGNEELKEGENTITILVKSEDGKTITTYQIIVNKLGEESETIAGTTGTKPKSVIAQNKLPVAIFGAAILAAIVCLILIIRSGRKVDDFDEQLEEDEKESKKDILDTEVPEEAYSTNQYLNELREREGIEEHIKAPRGRRFKH